ncbi:uncharacterized protein LOC144006639 isoform X2 [Festucalex cinctus]
MPRGKGYHRSQAATKRMTERLQLGDVQQSFHATCTRGGTGGRHKVQEWPISCVTGRSHKLVIPSECPNKKFVLLIGDLHLRSIADGFVEMPKGSFSFGVMSTPGACATELTTEVQHAVVPRTPDVVCLLAPSNNLTSSRTPDEAGADFCRLLGIVCGRWPNKVFVLDFPPRLTVDVTQQDYLRQEFHRVSARMGVKYMSIAAFFPLKNLKLWSKDGVHLSDDHGMSILVQLMCDGVHQQLDLQTPKLEVQVASRPPAVKTIPKIVVKGETLVLRRLNPFEWTVVGPGRKRRQAGLEQSSDGVPKKRKIQHNVVLKECFIPLTPVWFSSEMLGAMDKIKPSDLSSPVKAAPRDKKKSNVRYGQRVVFKRTKSQATPRPLVDASLSCSSGVEKVVQEEARQRMVVDASICSSSVVEEVVQEEATQRPLVDASLSCSSGVEKVVQEEARDRMVVDASLCSSCVVEEVVQQEVTQRPLVDAGLCCSSGVKEAVQELPRERTSRMQHAAKISPKSIQSGARW